MIQVEDAVLQKNIDWLQSNGQGHIFRFWNELNDQQRTILLNQVKRIDTELLSRLINLATGREKAVVESFRLEPVEVVSLQDRLQLDPAMKKVGQAALREGRTAAFLVAGGQGSRLGFEGPKGCFPVTPVRKKSLYQLHAEKILAVSRRYGATIPWYIMTSHSNHEQTVEFFRKHNFFGLHPSDVIFFRQEMLPAMDRSGKLLLTEKYRIFESPNGHGGSLKALWDSGALDDMKKRGIEYIYYFQVDNVLLNICDPVFLGYHIHHQSEMSSKVVRKESPEDKVGVICRINGKTGVVEYSDLKDTDKYATTDDGRLKYWAGSIAIHMIDVAFIEKENRQGFQLPYHLAFKNIPYIDDAGTERKPDEKNGVKFETFVFDALLDTRKTFTLEVDRRKEFSAVKNSSGTESPQTARDDLIRNYWEWLQEAGFKIPRNSPQGRLPHIEISPLFALDAEDVRNKKESVPDPAKVNYIE